VTRVWVDIDDDDIYDGWHEDDDCPNDSMKDAQRLYYEVYYLGLHADLTPVELLELLIKRGGG
jgi:hypothetical protein